MPTIKFVKEKKEVEVADGTNLRKAALSAGVNLYNGIGGFGAGFNRTIGNCHGLGLCGTCQVLITKGMENTSKMGLLEKAKFRGVPTPDPMLATVTCLAYIGHEDTMRLACQTKVEGDIEVETCPEFNLFGENFFS
jgi:ferredoxin